MQHEGLPDLFSELSAEGQPMSIFSEVLLRASGRVPQRHFKFLETSLVFLQAKNKKGLLANMRQMIKD